MVAAQGKPLAPSYNGNSETAITGLFAFEGKEPEGNKLSEICAFADGCVAAAQDGYIVSPFYEDNVSFTETKKDTVDESKLKNPVTTGLYKNLGTYIKKGVRGIGHIVLTQIKAR